MGRNRFVSAKVDVNCFRSNLMLLVNNLFPQGLPVSKLLTEYKKYFHEDIKVEPLAKSVGLNLTAIAAKQTKENKITEIWSRIFSTPCLYEFFYVEEPSAPENDGEDGAEEKAMEHLIKARRGRTVAEMHILARLASFKNIEFVRSNNGKGNVDTVLDLCEDRDSDSANTNSEESSKSSEPSGLKEYTNPRKRKLVIDHDQERRETVHASTSKESVIDHDEKMEIRETAIASTSKKLVIDHDEKMEGIETATASTKMSARLVSTSGCHEMVHKPEKLMKIVTNNVVASHSRTITVTNTHPEEVSATSNATVPLARTSTTDSDCAPNGSGELLNGKDKKTANTNESITTVVLTNFKGETKIVQYVKAKHICSRCNESYSNEVLLARHKKSCLTNLETKCHTCGVLVSTILNFPAHRLECSNANASKEDHVDQKINSQEDQETVSQITEITDKVPTPNTGPHLILVTPNEGAVSTRTRSSSTSISNE